MTVSKLHHVVISTQGPKDKASLPALSYTQVHFNPCFISVHVHLIGGSSLEAPSVAQFCISTFVLIHRKMMRHDRQETSRAAWVTSYVVLAKPFAL